MQGAFVVFDQSLKPDITTYQARDTSGRAPSLNEQYVPHHCICAV